MAFLFDFQKSCSICHFAIISLGNPLLSCVDITASWCACTFNASGDKNPYRLDKSICFGLEGLVQQLQDLDNAPDHCHSQLSMWHETWDLTPKQTSTVLDSVGNPERSTKVKNFHMETFFNGFICYTKKKSKTPSNHFLQNFS